MPFSATNKGPNITLGEGNEEASNATTSSWNSVLGIEGRATGKYWFKITLRELSQVNYIRAGVATSSATLSSWLGSDAYGWSFAGVDGQTYPSKATNNTITNLTGWTGAAPTEFDSIYIAVDLDDDKLYSCVNGDWGAAGVDFDAGTGWIYDSLDSGTLYPAVSIYGTNTNGATIFEDWSSISDDPNAPTGFAPWTEDYETWRVQGSTLTLSDSDRLSTSPVSSWRSGRGLVARNSEDPDGWYLEFSGTGAASQRIFGVSWFTISTSNYLGVAAGQWGFQGHGAWLDSGSSGGYGSGMAASTDIIGIAIRNGKIYAAINNVWQQSSDPEAETSPMRSTLQGMVVPAASLTLTGDTVRYKATTASQTYAPPAGYKPWSDPPKKYVAGTTKLDALPESLDVHVYDYSGDVLIDTVTSGVSDGAFLAPIRDVGDVLVVSEPPEGLDPIARGPVTPLDYDLLVLTQREDAPYYHPLLADSPGGRAVTDDAGNEAGTVYDEALLVETFNGWGQSLSGAALTRSIRPATSGGTQLKGVSLGTTWWDDAVAGAPGLSFSCLVCMESLASLGTIVQWMYGSTGSDYGCIVRVNTDGSIGVWVRTDSGDSSAETTSSTGLVVTNRVHHIGVVADLPADKIKIFVDGVKDTDVTRAYGNATMQAATAANSVWLGSDQDAANGLRGLLSHFAYYRTALSDARMQAHATAAGF